MIFSSFSYVSTAHANQLRETQGSDVQGHWAEPLLQQWSEAEVLRGYSDGTMRPDQSVTRAEFSAMLQRVFGISGTGTVPFSDVQEGTWYAPSIVAAHQSGYIKGYEDGTFRPNSKITRSDAAIMLSRTFQLSEIFSKLNKGELEAFTDYSQFRAYYSEAVNQLILADAIKGYPDGTFLPDRPVTRAEAVTMIGRLAGKLYNKPVVSDSEEVLRNAVINTDGVKLSNKEISGNLYLAQGIGSGEVILENTTVKGVTIINGGGQDSIYIKKSKLAKVILNSQWKHPVRIVVEDQAEVQQLVLRSPAIVQTTAGALIQNLEFTDRASGTTISGDGEIKRAEAKNTGIMVNGQEIKQGKAFFWSTSQGAFMPITQNNEPGSESVITQPPAIASKGSLPGTTKLNVSATHGNTVAVLIANERISTPIVGEVLPKSSLLIHPYQSGSDISGVDPTINKYIGLYEVDNNGKIVRFQQIVLREANIKAETWQLVWNDEFEKESIDNARWNLVHSGGGFGNNELQYYTNRDKNARVENGNLVIEAHEESYEGYEYTSAKLTTQGKGDWTYGKFEIRAKMPEGKGIWPAIWMMPTDDNLYSSWPAGGEIDIMELLGHAPDTIHGTLHYGQPHEQVQGSYSLSDGTTFAEDFHTFAVEWEPGEFRFYVDGILYAKQNNWFSKSPLEGGEYTYPAPFDRDFFLQLNLAVGGNWPGNPDETTKFTQKMLVDYVRVYEREGQVYRQPVAPTDKTIGIRNPGEDGNYVENGDFEEGITDWVFQPFAPPTDLFGGEGVAEIEQGALKTTITAEGNENHAIQFVQSGLPLIKGSTYKLSFDAWSSGERNMVAALTGPDRGYTRYMDDQTVSLTGERQQFEYTFTMKAGTDPNARLEFNMGKAGTLPVWIDKVSLIKTADPNPNAPREALASGNLIYNGTFDQGKDRLGFWYISGTASENANYYVGSAISDRKLYVKPASPSNSDSLLLSQDLLPLEGGKTYILSFSAKAGENVKITAQVGDQEQLDRYVDETLQIGTELQSYSVILETDVVKESGKLQFGLGALTSWLELDNISLKEMSHPVVINGTKRIEAENYSDMHGVQKGEDGLSVGWIDPGDWMQYIIDVQKAGEYKISYFVASGYEGGGSLTLLGKQGSVYTKNLSAGEIKEEDADFSYTFDIANTGDWGRFVIMEQSEPIQLEEGIQTLQIYAPHVNVDYFILTDPNQQTTTSNLVRNGSFDTDVGEWQTYMPDKLSISAEDGYMQIQLSELAQNIWEQQVYQEGIPLEQGVTYTVTFDIYSKVDRPIQLSVGNIDPNNDYAYTDFLDGNKPTFWLTSKWEQKQFSFVMNYPTEANAKLEFNLGQLIIDGNVYDEAGDIYLDNVRLSANLIKNGLFNNNLDHWSSYWGDEYNGTASGKLSYDNGEMVVEIDSLGGQNWIPQISQEGFRLEQGKEYQLSFDARATAERSLNVGIGKSLDNDPWYISYNGNDFDLTTEMQRYSVTFTMNAETEDNAKIDFNVGLSDVDVILDNIVIIQLD